MKINVLRAGLIALIVGGLGACGGGGGGGGAAPPAGGGGTTPTPPTTAIPTAAADPANDSATNPNGAFTVVEGAGQTVVTVGSPPKINFTVISDGEVVKGLTNSNVRFIIAKLVRGTNGNPDDWASYTYRTETATAGVGPGGTPVLASAAQATTDPNTPEQLVYNDAGYYTYTFSTDITDPTKTNGVTYEPSLTHRVSIQLSYTNKAGKTVQVNPYYDFTIDSTGKSVAVTDAANTRKVVDVTSCNQCHNRLALHGGGRIDPQYCVLCHNNGTTDANSGLVLRFKTMVHKIHAGRLLHTKGEDYTIWGYRDTKHDYSEVGFPQDLRNCTKCHDGNKAPQATNWKERPSKEACLTCHQSGTTSDWYNIHITNLKLGADAASVTNADCATCHGAGKTWAPDQAHFNQSEVNAAKYKVMIDSATYDSAGRKITVKYALVDPTNSNAAYDLSDSKFSPMRLYVAYGNLPGQSTSVTEFTSYNNGGSNVRVNMSDGTNDGTNHYTAEIAIPADSATAVAAGTARILSSGRVLELKLDPISRQPVDGTTTENVSVQHAWKEFAISGTLTARRTVVSTEKCNACHSTLGTGSGSNTLHNAFHRGERNYVEACVHCHDAGRVSGGTVMADGSAFNESYHFKRMIHALHAAGTSVRTYPFTHDNTVQAAFNKDCVSTTDPMVVCADGTDPTGVTNFAKEVVYPGLIQDCNACHVNDSWKQDRSPLGSVIVAGTTQRGAPDAKVISPKAATCTACHDSLGVQTHVVNVGGATFGTLTQADIIGNKVFESCDGCHAPGGFVGIDAKHGLN